MVRLVLFDIDGTLIRTGGAGMRAFARVFESEFATDLGLESLNFGGRTDFSLVREFFTRHGIPPTPENFDRFFTRYGFWLDHHLEAAQAIICAGVPEFLAGLRAHTPPPLIGLLTGNVRLGAELKLRHLGLWDHFRTGAFADDHEERPRIAAIARERGCRALGEELREDQVLVIGDTPLDIHCARAIGARVLAVATGGSTLEELRAHRPDWAAATLQEIEPAQVLRV